MEIVRYPDPRLRARNAAVERFDEDLAGVAREMFRLMYATKGVGLAAPQVGLNLRLMVFNAEGEEGRPDGERVLCNPRIVSRVRTKESDEEGCLSFPGIYGQVVRPTGVTVEAQDLEGKSRRLQLEGWEARVFLHEFDHLDGILFIDRMSPADRTRIRGQLADLEEAWRQRAQA